MKRPGILIIAFTIAFAFQSCNSGNKTKEIAQYEYSAKKVELNDFLSKKVGSWIKEGSDCYGIIMASDPDGNITEIKEVKAKVLMLQSDKIKMKAMENVNVGPKSGCEKMGISKGETWWEEEGDLFQTKEAAQEFIKNYKSQHQPVTGSKFTVD